MKELIFSTLWISSMPLQMAVPSIVTIAGIAHKNTTAQAKNDKPTMNIRNLQLKGIEYQKVIYEYPDALRVLVVSSYRAGYVQVQSTNRRNSPWVSLKLPNKFQPDGLGSNNKTRGFPQVVRWKTDKYELLLFLLASMEFENEHGFTAFIYERKQANWQLLNTSNLDLYFWAAISSFYLEGKRMVLWQPVMKENEGNVDPHQYRLRLIEFDGEKFKVEKDMKTQNKYSPRFLDASWKSLTPGTDPLKEFKMRWRWWGERVVAH